MELSKDKLARQIINLATPAVLENISHTMLHLADAVMIACLGSVYLAAVAIAGVIVWRVIATPGCIYAGAVAMVARYYGAREFDKVRTTVAQALLMSLGIGLVITVFGIAGAGKFMTWMGAEPDVAQAGRIYLKIVLAASFFYLIEMVGAGCLRAAGDTRTPMFVGVFMNILNIALSLLLIFGVWFFPKLGIKGAALGTAIASITGGIFIVYVLFTSHSLIQISLKDLSKVRFDYIKKIIEISIPFGLEEIVRSVGVLAFVRMIAVIGTVALAAHTIAIRIESISFTIGWGFAIAATTLVGQSLGKKDLELARLSFKYTTIYSVCIMSIIGAAFLFFPGLFLRLFQPEPDVWRLGIFCVQVMALEQPLLALTMTLSGGIRGSGDTISPLLTGLLGVVFVRIFLCYILAFPLGMGFKGIYYGMVIDWAFRSAAIYYLYRRGRWTRIAL